MSNRMKHALPTRSKRKQNPVRPKREQNPAPVPPEQAGTELAVASQIAPLNPIQALVPEGAYVPLVTRALGASYGEYPKFMDEILERCLLVATVTTGTGNQVINLSSSPLAVHASIVGIEGTGSPRQVTTALNSDGNLAVTGSDGLTWSVLVLTQRGTS